MLEMASSALLCMLCIAFSDWYFGPLGFVFGIVGYVAVAFGLFRLAKLRHVRAIRLWSSQQQLAPASVRKSDAFIDPAPMPWWQSWAAYDVSARTPDGSERHLFLFLAGTFFCLWGIEISMERDDDNGGQKEETHT